MFGLHEHETLVRLCRLEPLSLLIGNIVHKGAVKVNLWSFALPPYGKRVC